MDQAMHILLIEDNPGDAFLIKFYLEESIFKDAQLIHAEFLKTGLDLLARNEINVILLDLNLPDSNGTETLKAVLEQAKNAIVIVLTGLDDEDLGLETVKMGAQDFLVKGQFDGKVLTSSVRYAFERYQLQKQVASYTGQLDEYQRQFDLAQQINNFGYWELNLNDQSMYWTDNLKSILGDPENHPSFKNLLALMSTDSYPDVEAAFKQAIKQGEPFNVEFQLKSTPTKFVCRGKPAGSSNGSVTQLVGTIQQE